MVPRPGRRRLALAAILADLEEIEQGARDALRAARSAGMRSTAEILQAILLYAQLARMEACREAGGCR